MTTLEPVSGQFFLYFKYSSIQEKHLALHQRTVSERTLELSSKYHPTPLYPVIFTPLHPHDLTEEAEWLKHIKLSIQSWICTQENKLLPVWQGEGQGRYCLVWDINWTFALKFFFKKKVRLIKGELSLASRAWLFKNNYKKEINLTLAYCILWPLCVSHCSWVGNRNNNWEASRIYRSEQQSWQFLNKK